MIMVPPTPVAATAAITTTKSTSSVVEKHVEHVPPVNNDGGAGGESESGDGGTATTSSTPSSTSLARRLADGIDVGSPASAAAAASAVATNAAHALERATARAAGLMIRHDSSQSSSKKDRGSRSSHGSGSSSCGVDDRGRRSRSCDSDPRRNSSQATFECTMKRISRRSIELSGEGGGDDDVVGGRSNEERTGSGTTNNTGSGMCPKVDPEDRQIIRTFMLSDVRTRRYRLRTYKRVFVGSDVVDALISNGLASSRDEAVRLGRRVENKYGLFEHVHRNHNFEDEYLFYRFKRKTKEADSREKRWSDKSNQTTATARTSTSSSGDGGRSIGAEVSGGSGNTGTSSGRASPVERKDSEASGMSLITCSVSSDDDEEGEGEVSYPSNGFCCPLASSSSNSASASSSSSSSSSQRTSNAAAAVEQQPTASSEEMGMEIVNALRTGLEIRDRKYYGRTYKNCFVGRDAVSLLIEDGYTDCRVEAVVIANVVGQWYDLFEHVSGSKSRHSYVEDDYVFYRFKERREPRHSRTPPSSQQVKEYSFSTADRDKIARQWIEIFRKVDVRDRTWRLKPYHAVFVGSEAVDLLVKMSLARSRADAVRIGRIVNSQLHLFEHVAGEHDFDDEYLFFRFRE